MIRISEPCRQDFAAMPKVEGGAYCSSCQHVVKDFSNFSQAELIDYFNNYASGKVCGSFRAYQLSEKPAQKRLYRLQSKLGRGFFFRAAGALILFFSLLSCQRRLIDRTSGPMLWGDCDHPEHQKNISNTRTLGGRPDSTATDSSVFPADTLK